MKPTPGSWPDERLVKECRKGNQEAWSALVDKYKNLIYSIPIKQGFSREETTDIFQTVCLGLLSELEKLREPKALPAWLIQVTAHHCSRVRREQERFVATDLPDGDPPDPQPSSLPADLLAEVEREQALREALDALPARCNELIRMLFFETPPQPYEVVAKSLGLATGSVGFIRMRCLDKLRRNLEQRGFR